MRLEQSFVVGRPPEQVFDFVADPARLGEWRIDRGHVEPLTGGPPREGLRLRERVRARKGREFEQVVEYAEFDRPRRLRVRVVEGPMPGDSTWSFEPHEAGTRVDFLAEAELPGIPRPLQPLTKLMLARELARQHDRLRRFLEGR